MSKNGVKHLASVALTAQKYNREIAVYEFSGKFFFGGMKIFPGREKCSHLVKMSFSHLVKMVF